MSDIDKEILDICNRFFENFNKKWKDDIRKLIEEYNPEHLIDEYKRKIKNNYKSTK